MEYLLQMNLWKTSAQLQYFHIATLPSTWRDPRVLSFLFLQSHLFGSGSNEFTLPCLLELFSWFFEQKAWLRSDLLHWLQQGNEQLQRTSLTWHQESHGHC